ncbi:MAG TPA: lysophospholipid acyltransferase family protein [Acetobacteraceae bacterium]|nr:lysophospholipid acyltransferase family protein [Acetobacteraceae bacterium]
MKRLLRHPAVQILLARVLGLYLAFALRTTRWHLEGGEHVAPHAAGAPAVAAFWHERLALMPMFWLLVRRWPQGAGSRTSLRVHVLVSQHRDGRFIGAVVSRFAANVVLGSTSRGGATALRALLGRLGDGDLVVITPDGPRGPRRVAAPGVAQLAALSGVPVLPCAAQTSRRWVLQSWDHMVIPRPFGRGVLVCRPPIAVPRHGWQDAVPLIAEALDAAAAQADRLCVP